MKNRRVLFLVFAVLAGLQAFSQINIITDSVSTHRDNEGLYSIPKRPLRAGITVFSTNMGVWAFDRFVTNSEYSRINFNTIKSNFQTGFVWDEDMFATNLFAHPYHGGLYFNAARSNGMNYWQSIPYAAGGSLMWEFGMENEPPAINDFMATTIGGACLGEITFRISDLFIDNRAVGFERFGREFMATLFSPIRGINRLISGDMRRVDHSRSNSVSRPPIVFYATLGHRIIADNLRDKQDVINTLSYDLGLYYGNPFDEDNEKPFDFFMFKLSGNFFAQQPVLHRVNALGMLYSTDFPVKSLKHRLIFGVFQHFNFYQANSQYNHMLITPYKISEAASVGPGLLYKRDVFKHVRLLGAVHLSGILLGGSQTDHFITAKRDYNMGSGFSVKSSLELQFGSKARLFFTGEDYRIYSWIGSHEPNTDVFDSNSQGDVGHSSMTVARVGFQYIIHKHFLISTETSYIYRRSYYAYYSPSTEKHQVEENKVSLGYIF